MAALDGRAFLSAVAGRRRDRWDIGEVAQVGLRFAFYGRMSTSEFQDAVTSRAWQRSVSEELVEGFGAIVVEFFDEGCSRRWSWSHRPAASALLVAAEDPDRGFDAVVVGEYERAFHGDQFEQVVARLNAAGVQVWLPEAGGPVELDSPVHQALMCCWVLRRSVRWCVLGTGYWRRCGCRDGSWAVVRRTGTASRMPARTPTPSTPDGGGGCTCWRQTR